MLEKISFIFVHEFSQEKRFSCENKHSRDMVCADVTLFALRYHVTLCIACSN